MVVLRGLDEILKITPMFRKLIQTSYLSSSVCTDQMISRKLSVHNISTTCCVQKVISYSAGRPMPSPCRRIAIVDLESLHGRLLNCYSVNIQSEKLRRFHSTPFFGSNRPALSSDDIKKEIDGISEKFREAMDLINDARNSMGTVYFSEDMTDAEAMIEEVLTDYNSLLSNLTEQQKKDVVRSIGLKMEELKAQIQMVKDSIKE